MATATATAVLLLSCCERWGSIYEYLWRWHL